MSALSERIKAARAAKGITQEILADLTGYSLAAIKKIEAGGTHTIQRSAAMGEALDIPSDELALLQEQAKNGDASGAVPNAALAFSGAKLASQKRGMIPVVGRAAASGETGKLIMLNEVSEYVPVPVELEGVADGYAVYVYGESMEPRYFAREVVYVHPYRPVAKGDFCVVQIGHPDAECAYLKRFVTWTPEEIVLEQYNPPMEIRFPKGHVRSIGLVVGSGSI